MNQPLLSICIPTYNRARYLERLLQQLTDDMQTLPIRVEIIVSDNASSDDTPDICARAGARLGETLRYFRQSTNIGALRNVQFAFSVAKGEYCVYLADDDMLLWQPVLDALGTLQSNKAAVALYAPWIEVDLKANRVITQFYKHEERVAFSANNRASLAQFILKNRIFSEIGIYKTSIRRLFFPSHSDIAHWAFTVPVELLAFGDVIYDPKPFYGFMLNHPGMPPRRREGVDETIIGWDRYRGGIEHLIGLARGSVDAQKLRELFELGETIILERMLVSLRLRIHNRLDPVDSYFLASRLCAYGCEDRLPIPMRELRIRAALSYLTEQIGSVIGAQELILIGYSADDEQLIKQLSSLPVRHFDGAIPFDTKQIALIKTPASSEGMAKSLASVGYFIQESLLLSRFP